MRHDVLLGAESTHLFLDVQLVFELPVGQVMSGLGLFPPNQAVRPVAVHTDIVGWAKYFCNENPGHSPERASAGPRRSHPVLPAAPRGHPEA